MREETLTVNFGINYGLKIVLKIKMKNSWSTIDYIDCA